MKKGFYKTNGVIDISTGCIGNTVSLKKDYYNLLYFNKQDILFLKKCIDEILEDEDYE